MAGGRNGRRIRTNGPDAPDPRRRIRATARGCASVPRVPVERLDQGLRLRAGDVHAGLCKPPKTIYRVQRCRPTGIRALLAFPTFVLEAERRPQGNVPRQHPVRADAPDTAQGEGHRQLVDVNPASVRFQSRVQIPQLPDLVGHLRSGSRCSRCRAGAPRSGQAPRWRPEVDRP